MEKIKQRLKAALLASLLAVGLCFVGSTGTVLAAEADGGENVTVVDLTDLYTGAEVSHDCSEYLVTKYDDTNHWQECGVCGKKYTVNTHNLTTVGTETCRHAFAQRKTYCTDGCGYSVNLPYLAHGESRLVVDTGAHCHHYICSICGEDTSFWEPCRDSSGRLLGCEVTGTCSTCGTAYTEIKHAFAIGVGTNCYACGTELFKVERSAEVVGQNTTRCTWILTPVTDAVPSMIDAFGTCAGVGNQLQITNQSHWESGGKYYYQADFTATDDAQYTGTEAHWYGYYSQNGKNSGEHTSMNIKADNYAPEFTSVKVDGNGTSDNYSKKASITAVARDGWTSSINLVYMRLIDSDGNVLSDWGTASRDGTTYTRKFDVFAETLDEEKTLYVEAKDICDNTSQYEVNISYLDSKAPVVTSEDASTTDWSKSKEITFSCTDQGVGNVEIAFNNMDDFEKAVKSGDTYSRTYRFIGDVYGSVKGAVYFRDGAGNVTTQFVTISNLDSTAPNINEITVKDHFNTEGQADGWMIHVNADDICSKTGTEAGVTGYAITKVKDKPDAASFQSEPDFIVSHSGSYYIWAKDAAGNVTVSGEGKITSDLTYNGLSISGYIYNGTQMEFIYYNGKRLRL